MDNFWMQILAFALPGGFLGSVFTWIFSRRKRNNDFLRELQDSINLLSNENKEILKENVLLRRENVDLKANQEEMLVRIDQLTKEVERLRKAIGKKTGYEHKTTSAARRASAGGVRSDEANDPRQDGVSNRLRTEHTRRRANCRHADDTNGDDPAADRVLDSTLGTDGTGAAADGPGELDGREPP